MKKSKITPIHGGDEKPSQPIDNIVGKQGGVKFPEFPPPHDVLNVGYWQTRIQAIVDEYKCTHDAKNAEMDEINKKGFVFVRYRKRVRGGKTTFELDWTKQNCVKTKAGGQLVRSIRITKGSAGRTATIYPESSFRRHARDWELPMIMDTERRLEICRIGLRTCYAIQRQVKTMQKLLNENPDIGDES